MGTLGTTFNEEYLYGKPKWVLRGLHGHIGEGEMAVQTQPCVVEPEAHEGQQEVDLLVDLGLLVPSSMTLILFWCQDSINLN